MDLRLLVYCKGRKDEIFSPKVEPIVRSYFVSDETVIGQERKPAR
jgi:hypothetical protein